MKTLKITWLLAMALVVSFAYSQERDYNNENENQNTEQADPTVEQDMNLNKEDEPPTMEPEMEETEDIYPQDEMDVPESNENPPPVETPEAMEAPDPTVVPEDSAPEEMQAPDPTENIEEETQDQMQEPEESEAPAEEAPEELELPENEEVTSPEELDEKPGDATGADATLADISLDSWAEASRKAVEEVTAKYGEPDGVTDKELTWYDAGKWKRIRVSSEETNHDFPLAHTDMLEMTVQYDVPEDKMDELGAFDGSVTFDKTQGLLSARCDTEKNNILALNLAHDIIQGKKTVEEARAAYADAITEMMKGGTPDYQQELMFSADPQAADPDTNTTGLTKEEVMKKMKKKTKID